MYTDVTERRAAQDTIERLARTDALTGLTNRHALPVALDQALVAAERDGRPLCVLFIDLDRFKAINDSLGHEAGDQVLVEAAQRLHARLRASDIVARIGGDEFVVALTGIQDEADAARVALQIVQAMSEPFTVDNGAHGVLRAYVTPSIGIASFPRDGRRAAELLRLADIAMYHAKGDGGAGWRYYTPAMNEQVLRRIDLEARQFDREGLAERIREAFAAADPEGAAAALPLLGIEFEITEGAMMRDPRRAEAELSRLRELGARIAIDDFGTGYSSLAYLKHLPIDRLKIDRTFVRDVADDADDAAIVTAAVALAHRLGREAVAEGVETAAQLHAQRQIGCDAVQGFGLERPMPALQVGGHLQRVARGEHLALWRAAGQSSGASEVA
ncbi:MAG: putative bifunctional diguanylate cyclase/phosphodiesterase [Tepidimonas sp.]